MLKVCDLVLAKSSNRKVLADQRNNPVPIIGKYSDDDFHMHSFNFFTKGSSVGELASEFWITKKIEFSELSELNFNFSKEAIEAIPGFSRLISEIIEMKKELHHLKIDVFGILLPDFNLNDVDWNSTVFVVAADSEKIKVSKSTVQEIANRINKITNRDTILGRKGLQFSTSAIETFLSKTSSIYPGDCDALVFYKNEPKFILEFKKHTLNQPIENFTIEKYFKNQDQLKYLSLQALSLGLKRSANHEIPILIYYFATNFSKIRIDFLSSYEMRLAKTTRDLDAKNLEHGVLNFHQLLSFIEE